MLILYSGPFLESPLLHDAEVVQDFVSPLPLFLCLLGCESAVPGQRCEVVPVVHGEGLKGPIGALGKDVVGCVFCWNLGTRGRLPHSRLKKPGDGPTLGMQGLE